MEDKISEARDKKCLILPPIKINQCQRLVPWLAYYMIISEVPKGKVVIEDEVQALMEKVYGGHFEFEPDSNRVSLCLNHTFPYWRLGCSSFSAAYRASASLGTSSPM